MNDYELNNLSAVKLFLGEKSNDSKKLEDNLNYISKEFFGVDLEKNIEEQTDTKEREDFYHTIFYLTAVLFSDNNLAVNSELMTSKGRIDMLIETEKIVYIIEFKCNQGSSKAIKQIKDKYKIKEKEIILIGINFSTQGRNIKEVEIE